MTDDRKELVAEPVIVSTGERGPAGDTGVAGDVGAAGERGRTGPTGHDGERGQQGDDGRRGETGFPGQTGQQGEGERGPQGDPGQRGETGATGKGDRGPMGDHGQDGRTGYPGARGARGTSFSRAQVVALALFVVAVFCLLAYRSEQTTSEVRDSNRRADQRAYAQCLVSWANASSLTKVIDQVVVAVQRRPDSDPTKAETLAIYEQAKPQLPDCGPDPPVIEDPDKAYVDPPDALDELAREVHASLRLVGHTNRTGRRNRRRLQVLAVFLLASLLVVTGLQERDQRTLRASQLEQCRGRQVAVANANAERRELGDLERRHAAALTDPAARQLALDLAGVREARVLPLPSCP